MSNFYLDVIKDRLYCDGKDSLSRRSAQTAIYYILDAMTRLLAPILSFTADEIWLAMPHRAGDDGRNVCLNDMPAINAQWTLTEEEEAYWSKIMRVRTDVNKALEIARAAKTVGKPLDARITLFVSELNVVYGAGEGVPGENFDGLTVLVETSTLPKCGRCWTHSASVGENSEHPELCARCAAAI